MKTFTRLFSLAIVALVMTACGSNNNGQIVGYNADGTPIYGNGTQTGYYNGAQGGCVPLQSALSFSVQGPRISATDLLAGMLPANSRAPGQYGQVIMGQGVVNQQQYGYTGSMMLTKQSSNGTLQLQVSQNQVTGSLQLNQYIAQMLMAGTQQVYGSNGSYNMQYPSQGYNTGACVSSIAVDAVYTAGYNGQGYINQALVYLYMSNSQQPIGPIPLY